MEWARMAVNVGIMGAQGYFVVQGVLIAGESMLGGALLIFLAVMLGGLKYTE